MVKPFEKEIILKIIAYYIRRIPVLNDSTFIFIILGFLQSSSRVKFYNQEIIF